jgi:hypothetical protein
MQRNRRRTLQLRFRKCFPHEIGALWTRNILFPLGIQRILFSYVSNMLSHTLIILLSFYFICELPAAFCHWGNNRVHVQNKRCYRVGLCFSLLYYCSFYQWRCFYAAGFFCRGKTVDSSLSILATSFAASYSLKTLPLATTLLPIFLALYFSKYCSSFCNHPCRRG